MRPTGWSSRVRFLERTDPNPMNMSLIFCTATFGMAPSEGGLLPYCGTQKSKTPPPIAAMRQEKPRRARIVSCRQKRTTALPQAIRVHTAAGGADRS